MKATKENITIINTLATLAVATAVIMVAVFILFYYVDNISGIKDAWSTIGGFFGGFATLTAAYIASRLFNDWRFEKDHETKVIYLNNAIKILFEIQSSLLKCKLNTERLMLIEENLILLSEVKDDFSKSHRDKLITLKANITVIENLFKENQLHETFSIFEQYIKQFDDFNLQISNSYNTYFYYYIDCYASDKLKHQKEYKISRPIFPARKLDLDPTHLHNARLVLDTLNTHKNSTINKQEECIEYKDYIEKCLIEHDKLLTVFINALKAKNGKQ